MCHATRFGSSAEMAQASESHHIFRLLKSHRFKVVTMVRR